MLYVFKILFPIDEKLIHKLRKFEVDFMMVIVKFNKRRKL